MNAVIPLSYAVDTRMSDRTRLIVRWAVVVALVAFAYWCGWDGGYRMGHVDAELEAARAINGGR
jgi:type II secretory pathway component PulM